jgi:hypothetical protein
MMRRRAIALALLALVVPLPALALSGGEDATPFGPTDLSVAVSLDGCGTAADTIVCKLDATWNVVPGADRYTASVTRADGTVMDVGDVGAGSASFWVPYAGNGTYSVQVFAYGTPPDSDQPEVIAKDSSETGGGEPSESMSGPPDGEATMGSPTTGEEVDPGVVTEPEGPVEPAPEPEEPECEEPVEVPEPEEPRAADAAAAEALAAEESAAEAEAAQPAECPPPEPAP